MERGSSDGIASPDRFGESSPRQGHNSDAGDASPASSNYSSCDGSEFDRYCSANSALGTASICSSVGNYSELLDSVKVRSGFGDDFILEKFQRNRWHRDCLSDGGVESPRENGYSSDLVSVDRMGPLARIRTGSRLSPRDNGNSLSYRSMYAGGSKSSAFGSGSNPFSRRMNNVEDEGEGRELFPSDAEDCLARVPGNSCEKKIGLGENLGYMLSGSTSGYHFQGAMKLEEDGDTSPRCEHSEGEDSSLDYGTDEEGMPRRIRRNSLQPVRERRTGNENPLSLNSSGAFGLDDWDAFVEETGEDGLTSLSLYQDPLVQQQEGASETQKNVSVQSVEHEVDANDETVARCRPEVVQSASFKNPLNECEVREKTPSQEKSAEGLNFENGSRAREIQSICSKDAAGIVANEASEKRVPGKSEPLLSRGTAASSYSTLTRVPQGKEIETQEVNGTNSFSPKANGYDSNVENIVLVNSNSKDVVEEDLLPNEDKKLDMSDSYDEMVLEMEEILLDSEKSHGARFTQANRGYSTQQPHHFRDGSSSASTSGTDEVYPHVQHPFKIDRVEIVGAKQKKGDVSFGERLVGVKEYTVYKVRVWSDKDQWEVERRYRDFFALYRQLKTLFTENGLSLPPPWSRFEQESRKIFGNASPSVISERSTLIQDCLRSILNSRYPFGTPSSLVCFLSPGQALNNSGLLRVFVPQSLPKLGQDQNSNSSNCGEICQEDVSMLGKTISLVVEIKPHKSIRQLLEAQHYTCAGCHRHLDAGKTLLRELVQTFGWNKPRFCEYTGQLFCASCHTNDTAVLPAKVVHHWDFSLYPVSQLAKAYLESIYDQPMLCVSAVNPSLFSKVPALHHVMGIRKKIAAMLPYVRCPFRNSVQRSLGFRRHLLESNDFFALRDLVDLSKGAFAALPVMVETISNKILEHITQQCLVCYDSGVPCAARQACDDPSSLIFPFQEADAARCGSCGSVFHKPCFGKLSGCCPCCKPMATSTNMVAAGSVDHEGVSDRSNLFSGSSSSLGFFSDILSKARPDKLWRPKNSSPVILMGSLPGPSL